MNDSIKVLDHGLVRLVSYMQPANFQDLIDDVSAEASDWTGDLEVVRNARTSYDAEWRTGEDAGKDAKLIHRLDKDRHTSPFESMVFTFEVRAPIFVFRQWHRHRTWAYSEVSARYAELPKTYYVPREEQITTQSTSNKQMRTCEQNIAAAAIHESIKVSQRESFAEYKRLLALGCPRELARIVLPFGTYSHMFATVNLHNLLHFLTLRLHEHAQYEIRVFAEAILKLIQPIVPNSVAAWEIRRNAPLAADERAELEDFRNRARL